MIKVEQVCKRFPLKDAKRVNQLNQSDPRIYGRFFNVLDNVNFSCQQGEILGLLGANGAGKTSLLRILSTALSPDSGQVLYQQQNAHQFKATVRKKIGFLSGSTGLYDKLTGLENLQYFAKLFGMDDEQFEASLANLNQALDMGDYLNRRYQDYSTGMKQKVAIARAVIHQPDYVIFDEPTTGLDIAACEVVLQFMAQLKEQGKAVIFSTHHLDEVERLCDRVCIIERGKAVFEGDLTQLKQSANESTLQPAVLKLMQSSR
ncbi:ATP-binding cassette domain-containing protein [Catenovulum sp. SM1970]|uniref:ABC transporter ATP-binding protein n=1 Tax=Marinifaba aquimaris TaxID=2741323 RepID=UPI001573AD32|nr:ATP-binding cassette domain-containing protein [Marinifaba aquimaris]NTS78434.1 ATP-binding cassette domain-containing protein [Marinifaba aquimaris]